MNPLGRLQYPDWLRQCCATKRLLQIHPPPPGQRHADCQFTPRLDMSQSDFGPVGSWICSQLSLCLRSLRSPRMDIPTRRDSLRWNRVPARPVPVHAELPRGRETNSWPGSWPACRASLSSLKPQILRYRRPNRSTTRVNPSGPRHGRHSLAVLRFKSPHLRWQGQKHPLRVLG